jgi:hypothetical protein
LNALATKSNVRTTAENAGKTRTNVLATRENVRVRFLNAPTPLGTLKIALRVFAGVARAFENALWCFLSVAKGLKRP